jgi:hypothetical protein
MTNRRMTRGELEQWAAANYGVAENCEGNADERLMAGWVNAMDTEEDRGYHMSEEEFVSFAYFFV